MVEPNSPSRSQSGPQARLRLLSTKEFQRVFSSWENEIRRAVLPHPAPVASSDPVQGSGKAQPGEGEWALVGIKRRGAILARRLWSSLATPLPYGEIDISLYRDDYHLNPEKPMVLGTEIAFRVDGIKVLLVDDVLFTGRTVRAAMDLLLDFGRPRKIALAVFVDRGHRELPIAADFVGHTLKTEAEDQVLVTLSEMGEEDGVELSKRKR